MTNLIVPEIAAELRTSETTVYRLIKSRHLKAINLGARRYVVSRDELDDFIANGGVDRITPDDDDDSAAVG